MSTDAASTLDAPASSDGAPSRLKRQVFQLKKEVISEMAQAKRLASRTFELGKTALDLDGQVDVWSMELDSIRATHNALDSAVARVERRLTDWRNLIEGTCFDQVEHIEEQLWTEYDAFRAEHNVDDLTETWSDHVIDLDDQKRVLFRQITDAKSRIAYAAAEKATDADLQQVVTTARAENQAIATMASLSGTTPPSYSQGSSQVPTGTPLPQGTPASPDDFTSTNAPVTLEAPATSLLVTSTNAPGHSAAGGLDLDETVTIDTDMSARTMFQAKKPGAGFRNVLVTGSHGPASGANITQPTRKRVTIAADAARNTTFGSVNDTIPAGAPRHSTPKMEDFVPTFSPTNTLYASNEQTLDTIRQSYHMAAPSALNYQKKFCEIFRGDPGEFSVFSERFMLLVERQKPPLLPHQKLEVLLDHLDGAPKKMLSRFRLKDENYEEACNLLARTYGSEQTMRNRWLNELRALPSPDWSRAEAISNLFQNAYPLVAQLEGIGEDLSSRSIVTQEFLKKVPVNIRTDKIIARADNPRDIPLREVLEWVDWYANELRASVEATGEEVPISYDPTPRQDRHNHANEGKPFRNQGFHKANRFEKPPDRYGHAFAANVADQREGVPSPKSKFRCRMCDEPGHFPTECPQYPTAKQRLARANELSYCHACLRKEENGGQCKCKHNRWKCRHCKRGYHHIALCEPREKYLARQGSRRQQDRHPYSRRPTPPPQRRNTDRALCDQCGSEQGRTARTYSAATDHDRLPPYPDEEYCFSEPDFEPDQALYDELLDPEDYIPSGCLKQCCCGECDHYCPEQDKEPSDEDTEAHCHGGITPNGKNGKREACLLECCRAVVSNPRSGKSVETTVFFDGGSTHSFVREELAQELDLPNMGRYDLGVHTFAGPEAVPLHGFKSRINIRTTDGSPICINLHTSNHIASRMEAVFVRPTDLPVLRKDNCSIVPTSQLPGILIGKRDFLLFNRSTEEKLPSGFAIMRTRLGPIISGYGKIAGEDTPSHPALSCHAQVFNTSSADTLNQMAENFWHLENVGGECPKPNSDDAITHQRLRDAVIINDEGRYEVPLIFKTPNGEPPSNAELPQMKGLAVGRLASQMRSLRCKSELLTECTAQVHGMLERQEVEVIPPDERVTRNTTVYHPWQLVLKESSQTTKVRMVHDASARLKGKPSFNECLQRGPVLLPRLPGVLLRSRLHRIVILSDIAKAFMQVSIAPHMRDALRWLYLVDTSKPVTEDNLLYLRFRRAPFGTKISPFLLAAVLELHFQKYDHPVAREMWRSCYVDNVALFANSLPEAMEKYKLSKQICADAQINLREYASNSVEFNEAIPAEDRATLNKVRTLGISWQCLADTWSISLDPKEDPEPLLSPGVTPEQATAAAPKRKKGADNGPLTRRKALRFIARVFDPCGLVSPALVAAKLVLQQMWKLKHGWDQASGASIDELWREATADFDRTVIKIKRWVCDGPILEPQVHVYTDASAECYGFCVYLRCRGEKEELHSNLLFSRCKVKPLKEEDSLTIPRMELMGAVLGAQSIPWVLEELGLDSPKVFVWCDSTIVLHQLLNQSKHKETWVENRLKKIRLIRDEFKVTVGYVSTSENPADVISRGLPASELQDCRLWWHGSDWLRMDQSSWPSQPEHLEAAASKHGEDRQAADELHAYGSVSFASAYHSTRLTRNLENPLGTEQSVSKHYAVAYFGHIPHVPPPRDAARLPKDDLLPKAITDRCHTWLRLLRVTATVLRAVAKFARKQSPPSGGNLPNALGIITRDHFVEPTFTVSDLAIAQLLLVRRSQLQQPPTAYDRKQLVIYDDQGVLRVKGRLGLTDLPSSAQQPIFLSKTSRVATLLILHYHVVNLHCGVNTTLANVRMHYWFTHGRRTVQSVIRGNCHVCQRATNPHFAVPPWPQLPSERVTPSRPFRSIGIDYFGPKVLKSYDSDGKVTLQKHYVLILCCMSTRAVHLELVSDLSTVQFFHAFQRFCARRWCPTQILSDNGLSFLASRDVLEHIAPAGTVRTNRRKLPASNQPEAAVPKRPQRSTRGVMPDRYTVHMDTPRRKCRVRFDLPEVEAVVGSGLPHNAPDGAIVAAAITKRRNKAITRRTRSADAAPQHQDAHPAPSADVAATQARNFLSQKGITWNTITPQASWRGGAYERLIGLVKSCLLRTIGRRTPTVDDFQTLLCQAEFTVNCRPLTYVSNSELDFQVVRPIDFLIPSLQYETPENMLDPVVDDSTLSDPDYLGPDGSKLQARVVNHLRQTAALTDKFWQLWREGVLLDLRRCRDKSGSRAPVRPIEAGDVVLVYDEDVPRAHWKPALVEQLIHDTRGIIKSARIKLALTGNRTERAVNQLYPLGPPLPAPHGAQSEATDVAHIYTALRCQPPTSLGLRASARSDPRLVSVETNSTGSTAGAANSRG